MQTYPIKYSHVLKRIKPSRKFMQTNWLKSKIISSQRNKSFNPDVVTPVQQEFISVCWLYACGYVLSTGFSRPRLHSLWMCHMSSHVLAPHISWPIQGEVREVLWPPWTIPSHLLYSNHQSLSRPLEPSQTGPICNPSRLFEYHPHKKLGKMEDVFIAMWITPRRTKSGKGSFRD